MPNVVYFDNTMSGAPSLNNAVNTAVAVLDAGLVDGFGSVTVNSLVVASDVATATVSGGHQFSMVGNTGPVIRISGANPTALNGDWRVTVTSATVFTFATTGITDQTATGTISAKRAPAGFSKVFSGTNKAAYRSDDVTGNRHYLRVDDSIGVNARVRGFETMSNVDTGTGPFPTDAQISGGLYLYKSQGSNVPWSLFSDGKSVYFFCDTNNSNFYWGGLVWGEPLKYLPVDAMSTYIMGGLNATGRLLMYELGGVQAKYIIGSSLGVVGSLSCSMHSHRASSFFGTGGFTYRGDNLLLWPVEIWAIADAPRGLMPGIFNPVHTGTIPNGTLFENVLGKTGRTLMAHNTWSTSNQVVIDLTGPWE